MTEDRPVLGETLSRVTSKKVTVPLAAARSGQIADAARMRVSASRWQVLCRTDTAAGGDGFSTLPCGQMMLTVRRIPSLVIMSGSVMARTRYTTDARVLAHGTFSAPGTCPAEPDRSTVR